MKITYDPTADALYFYLQQGVEVETTEEDEDGVIVDYDKAGKIIGIEVFDARARVELLLPDASELLTEAA